MTKRISKPEFIFFTILFAFIFIRGLFLIYSDLNLLYPFATNDAFDWIANGLYYSGYDVNFSFRQPGLPIIIMLLEKNNLLNILPLINQLFFFFLILFSYKILRLHFSQKISLLTVLILTVNFFLNNLSFYILADLHTTLFLIIGLYYYLRAEKNKKFYLHCSISWTLSLFFQYAFIAVLPAIVAHFLIYRKKDFQNKNFIISAIIPFVAFVPYLIYKKIKFGEFFYSTVQHTELLKFHLDGIFFYLVNIISVLSIPVFVLITIGLFYLIKFKLFKQGSIEKKLNNLLVLSTLLFIPWFVFWVLLYDWPDKRFIVYLFPALIGFLGFSLNLLFKNFKEKSNILKLAIVCIYLILLFGSNLHYESFSTRNLIKLTNSHMVTFTKTVHKRHTSNRNITPDKAKLTKKKSLGFNALNLIKIHNLRESKEKNIKQKEKSLILIKEKSNQAFECIKIDKASIYRYGNQYGNYFKEKLNVSKDCQNSNLFINDKGELKMIP
ncbi:MAG: hypothetical protein GF347_02635 [Candidatus Moranbacteria bacterium]|nr:hypothetical protein [Candidatus Moranbacteria bacterium]